MDVVPRTATKKSDIVLLWQLNTFSSNIPLHYKRTLTPPPMPHFKTWFSDYLTKVQSNNQWEEFCSLDTEKQRQIFLSLLAIVEAFNDCSDDAEFYKYAWRMKVYLDRQR